MRPRQIASSPADLPPGCGVRYSGNLPVHCPVLLRPARGMQER